MLETFRKDVIFLLIVILGLYAGYKNFTGEIRDNNAWRIFKIEHSCKAITAVAWQCNDGKQYIHRGEN